MKRAIFALGVLLCIQSYGQQIVYKYTSTDFNVVIPNLKSGQYGLAGAVMNNISGAVMYKVNGIEHIIQNTADSLSPAIHFIKDNITGKWFFENYYPEASVTGGFRNYVFVDTLGTIAFSSTGSEAMQPWPHGDMLLCRTQGTKLVWTRISNEKSFYHSIGMGDLNGDGLLERLTTEFPRFRDVSMYRGSEVHIFKLAQLGIWGMHLALSPRGAWKLEDASNLTAFADYIVPVGLRVMDIFEYAPELEKQINGLVEVTRDSDAEIELRASSIYVIAKLTEEINKRRPGMEPLLQPQVDFRFWKTYHATHWPHHLTKTVMY